MQILKWVENYLKNPPPRKKTGGKEGGSAIDLLDVYGTEGTKQAKTAPGPSKIRPSGPSNWNNIVPPPPRHRRSKAEIEETLAFCRQRHGW